MRIDTDIKTVLVEIDGEEYEVAENTIATFEKIDKVMTDMVGKPTFRVWMAVIEILLGKTAYKKIFSDGKNENIDRIERIYEGVMKAYRYNSETFREEQEQEKSDNVADRIKPITDMVKELNKLEGSGQSSKSEKYTAIRRG